MKVLLSIKFSLKRTELAQMPWRCSQREHKRWHTAREEATLALAFDDGCLNQYPIVCKRPDELVLWLY